MTRWNVIGWLYSSLTSLRLSTNLPRHLSRIFLLAIRTNSKLEFGSSFSQMFGKTKVFKISVVMSLSLIQWWISFFFFGLVSVNSKVMVYFLYFIYKPVMLLTTTLRQLSFGSKVMLNSNWKPFFIVKKLASMCFGGRMSSDIALQWLIAELRLLSVTRESRRLMSLSSEVLSDAASDAVVLSPEILDLKKFTF